MVKSGHVLSRKGRWCFWQNICSKALAKDVVRKPALGRLRQERHRFKFNLATRSCEKSRLKKGRGGEREGAREERRGEEKRKEEAWTDLGKAIAGETPGERKQHCLI